MFRPEDFEMWTALRRTALFLAVCLLCCFAFAQENPCLDPKIESRPGRPAMTNGADPTQCGVLELEYGAEHLWMRSSHGSDVAGGIRLGITPYLDFHWSAGDFLQIADADGDRSGYGDNWLGFSYRYLTQTKKRPSLGVMYMGKLPTGDPDRGFGSGEVDHVLSFLFSKDVQRFHFDFNVSPEWMGVAHQSPDRNVGLSMAASVPVMKRFTFVLEPYGQTELNAETPAFVSLMSGGSFQVSPRFYLDAGFDRGFGASASGSRLFAGFTVAVANVYTWMRPADALSAKQSFEQSIVKGKDNFADQKSSRERK